METLTFRARVMKYAHHLMSTTKRSWRTCLLKAWELYRLAKRMRQGIVKFAFQKVDGTIRYAWGTLRDLPAGATTQGKGKPSFKTFAYFDTQKMAFRCFKIENLITVY